MENGEIETLNGQCRCCLAEGNHRFISKEYYWNGTKEVYSDMFLDCFNLFISSNINVSPLICESCVERLRDASCFKMLVLTTEQQLSQALESDDETMMLVNVPIAEDTLDATVGFKIELKNSKSECNELNSNLKQVTAGSLVTEVEYEICDDIELTTRTEVIPELEEIIEYPKEKYKTVYLTEKMAHINNVATILECSNVTAFKSKTRSGFPCFYCRDIYENFDKLRTHQNIEHTKLNLRKVLKKYSAESLVVYADVTDLKCTMCFVSMSNLKELKTHLTNVHDKKIYNKFTDRVIPFKLSDNNYFECQICGFNLETFGAVERHMNTHYRNYVCETCGTGFVTMLRLKTHLHSIHKEGKFPCILCDKVFTTQQRYKGHVDFVHKMLKKLKCPKCPERFSDYFVQQKHLVDVHGETPIVYRCNVCDRAFNRRYTLSCHIQRRHLEQRNVNCQLCPYMCYNKSELREHMLKHSTGRLFECSVCKKGYSRKKTLREHMRIHNNDKRFVCGICEHSFVHNCSLKTHMKTHHTDSIDL